MGLLSALIFDAFCIIVIWRSLKLVTKKQEGMFETAGDAQGRKVAGIILIVLSFLAMIINHAMSSKF